MSKSKETKEILSAVVFHDATYGPGDEDALEERLTAERCTQLQAIDPPVLAGDWKCKGKAEEPMDSIPKGKAERAEREAKKVALHTPPAHPPAHPQEHAHKGK